MKEVKSRRTRAEMCNSSDLLISTNDWRLYEAYVFGALQRRFPGARVRHNVTLQGLKTKRARQIDVLVEWTHGGVDLKIAFDCKCYQRKVNVNDVESFLGMLDDVRVSKGVLVTTKGFSKTADERARQDPRDIDLQILSPDRLSQYQGVGSAWLWKGTTAAIVQAPGGWVLDNQDTRTPGWCQFSRYPIGHKLESAKKMCPFLYGNIVLKTEQEPTMEDIATMHEKLIVEKCPNATFKRLPPLWQSVNGEPARTLFRVGHISPSYSGPEYSLYLDSPKGVLLLVLLCPEGNDQIYLPALKWVGGNAVLMERNDDPLGSASA